MGKCRCFIVLLHIHIHSHVKSQTYKNKHIYTSVKLNTYKTHLYKTHTYKITEKQCNTHRKANIKNANI